tara:strand:+ start:2306 stop:3871 length:1566 start_codon:yes stop_codon:yes gene_type:complete
MEVGDFAASCDILDGGYAFPAGGSWTAAKREGTGPKVIGAGYTPTQDDRDLAMAWELHKELNDGPSAIPRKKTFAEIREELKARYQQRNESPEVQSSKIEKIIRMTPKEETPAIPKKKTFAEIREELKARYQHSSKIEKIIRMTPKEETPADKIREKDIKQRREKERLRDARAKVVSEMRASGNFEATKKQMIREGNFSLDNMSPEQYQRVLRSGEKELEFMFHEDPSPRLQAKHRVVPPRVMGLLPSRYTGHIDNQKGAKCGFHSVNNVLSSDIRKPEDIVSNHMSTRVDVARELFRMRYEASRQMSDSGNQAAAMATSMHPRGDNRDLSKENLDGRIDPVTLEGLKFLDMMDQLMINMLMKYYGYEKMGEFFNGTRDRDQVRELLSNNEFRAIIHGGVGHWQAFVKRDGAFYDLNSSFEETDTRRIPLGLDEAAKHIAESYVNNRAVERTVRRDDGTTEKVMRPVGGQMQRTFFAFKISTDVRGGYPFKDDLVNTVDRKRLESIVTEQMYQQIFTRKIN